MTDIHPQLQQDCIIIGRFSLCHLLLMRDANYPWLILVPDRENITEIYQLSEEDQIQLMRESSHLGKVLSGIFQADKINIAALGNRVSQLHIHHVVRYHNDASWPDPVWGAVPAKPYSSQDQAEIVKKLEVHLSDMVLD